MKTLFTLQRIVILFIVLILPYSSFSQIPDDFLVWKYITGRIHSSVLLVDSFVFVGDMNGMFSKLNANTGEKIWSYQASTYIASHAACKDGIVVFEAGDRLHGLNAETGQLLWSFKSTEKAPTTGYDTDWHHSSPVIEGNTAYYGDEWGFMNGVNITTGELDFQYHIPYEYTTATDYNIRSTPVIQDSIIYFGDYDGTVYAISLNDKSDKWITKMETPRWDGSVVSEMVIDGGVIYCGRYTNALIPLDLETGAPLWKFSDWETFLPSTPVFYKDQVIIGTTISSNHIYSLNKSTGEKNWEIKVKGIFFVRPIIIQDSILVMNSTDPFSDKWGMLYFINLERGEVINEIHLENATESSPIFYNDMILIGGDDGLYALKYKHAIAESGQSMFSFNNLEETDTIYVNEALDKKYPLINLSDFCDTIMVGFVVDGDESKSNISFTERKGFHIRPSQKLDITLKAKANKLNQGDYKIKITIRSTRQSTDPLYEKTIWLKVNRIVGNRAINSKEEGWQVCPNPFNDHVIFYLEKGMLTEANLVIYALDGRMVYSLEKPMDDNRSLEWDGCDNFGKSVHSGVYIYTLKTVNVSTSGKLIKVE